MNKISKLKDTLRSRLRGRFGGFDIRDYEKQAEQEVCAREEQISRADTALEKKSQNRRAIDQFFQN